MRVAVLVTPCGPEELLVALPNTTADEAPAARVVEEGLYEAVPEVASGITTTDREGDTGEDLLQPCEPPPDSTWRTLNYPRSS